MSHTPHDPECLHINQQEAVTLLLPLLMQNKERTTQAGPPYTFLSTTVRDTFLHYAVNEPRTSDQLEHYTHNFTITTT